MAIKKRPTKGTTKSKTNKSIFGDKVAFDGTGQYLDYAHLVERFASETARTLENFPRNEDVTLRMQALVLARKSLAENEARLAREEYEHGLAEERAGEQMIRVMALFEVLSQAESARQSYMYRVRLRQELSDEERADKDARTATRLFEAYGDNIPDERHDMCFAGLRPPRNPAFLNADNPRLLEGEIAARAKRRAKREAATDIS